MSFTQTNGGGGMLWILVVCVLCERDLYLLYSLNWTWFRWDNDNSLLVQCSAHSCIKKWDQIRIERMLIGWNMVDPSLYESSGCACPIDNYFWFIPCSRCITKSPFCCLKSKFVFRKKTYPPLPLSNVLLYGQLIMSGYDYFSMVH